MALGVTSAAHGAGAVAIPPAAPLRARRIVGALLRHALFLGIAAAAFAAHEHFKLNGQAPQALASLVAAAGFGLMPLRALGRELLALERRVLHLAHAVGGLALLALSLGGVVSGRPILDRAALAPFGIMGAAQALTHADRPRSPEQAEALRRFVTGLPELRRLSPARGLASPADARRAVAVLGDLIAKAQALGATELRSDPGLQAALERAMTRAGLSFGLDTIDEAIGALSTSPAAAGAIPDLRRRVAAARKALDAP